MKDITADPKSAASLEVLDATLRERTFGVNFSTTDKLAIAGKLDSLGVAFIELPMAMGTVKDADYLNHLNSSLRNGSEAVLYLPREIEPDEVELPDQFRNITVNANCWQAHLTYGPSNRKLDPQDNLSSIRKRISSLKKQGKNVLFDAEHFFDAFFEDTAYALNVLEASVDSGVTRLVLCDTRGASLPEQVEKAVRIVSSHLSSRRDVVIGIHTHNDCGLAIANALAAVSAGGRHVQGTINGLGERSGAADLCQLLPLLILKLNYNALNSTLPKEEQLLSLKSLSEKVASTTGFLEPQRPFVGSKAFALVDSSHSPNVVSDPSSFEVINPAFVGNSRELGANDTSLILAEMSRLGLFVRDKDRVAQDVLKKMREFESLGYRFEDAKASLHLLILENVGYVIRPFEVIRWETKTSRDLSNLPEVIGTVEVRIASANGTTKDVSASERGVGPIHAIDLALKKSLEGDFRELKDLRLVSYSLNIVDSPSGTAAAARARTEFAQGNPIQLKSIAETWATTSVSDDVLDASIKALVDGYRYKLIFQNEKPRYAIPDWKVALSWRYSDIC